MNRNPAPSGTELAYIDDLTGLYNRRYLNLALTKEIQKVKKEGKKLSLFMIDYDGFKNINDTYGHLAGDQVLIELAGILKKEIGKSGMLVRYAGDEFTIVLPEKELKESVKIANSVLQLASKCRTGFKDGKKLTGIMLSIGVAVYPDDATDAGELLDKADQALYSSKRTGKNRVSTVADLVTEVHDRNLLVNAVPCKEFINREKELGLLKRSCKNIKKGVKKFILIEGKPGVGKTRLMLELINIDKMRPRFLLRCRKENVEQQYGAISDALNGLLDSLEVRKVLSVVTALSDINKYALVSTVDKIKDLPVRYSADIASSVKELREEDIFSAFVNFIKELKLEIITVLVDDILWVDRGSLKVIEWMAGEDISNGALVVATFSRDLLKDKAAQGVPFVAFTGEKKVQKILETIDLEPFTEAAASELLKAVFSGLSLPAEVEKKISRMSWGFPSNIEEIIKYILDSKIVYPKGEKWILDNKRVNMVPASFKELLDRRISELDDESREVLSKAAVLGRDFNTDVLASFHGKNEGELLDILDKLRDKGLLQQSVLTSEGALTFVNNIIKESFYNAIEKKRLQQLHRQVAGLLEDYYRSRIGRVYGKVRHHLREAGETDKLKSFAGKYDLLSYLKTAGIEEEVAPSIEEIIEAPLSEQSTRIASDAIFSLKATWLNSQLYPPDNKTRTDSISNLNNYITKILENDRTFTVTVSEGNIVINGRSLSKKKVNEMLSRAIASFFSDYGIDSITFRRGLNKGELESFFLIASQKADHIKEAGGFSKLLKKNAVANIKINEVRYRKASDLAKGSKGVKELFKKIIPTSQAVSDLFSVDNEGLAINKEILSDSERTINSLIETISAISKEDASEDSKSFVILEALSKTVGEFAKRDATKWEDEKPRLGEKFLSLEPLLRTKIIKDSVRHGKDVSNFVIDTLSGLDRDGVLKILSEGQIETKMSPDEFNEFLKTIVKSQYQKGLSYKEVQSLLKEAGINKETTRKALDDVFIKSFFDRRAKEVIGAEELEVLDKKSIDNLEPLTEALIVKGDTATIKRLAESLLARTESATPSIRISAIKAIGKVSEVLVSKEVFDISATIGAELSSRLKKEDDIDVYVEFLNDLELMIVKLIHKQNLSLLLTPLSAIKEEMNPSDQRPAEFKKSAEEAVNRVLSPENMELLLFSLKGKTKKDCLATVDLIAQFGEKALKPLMEVLFRKDNVRLDPFDVYMKKRHIAFIMKKIGEKAISGLKDLLNDKRPLVVKNVIEVLGNMDDKKYLPYIEQAVKHPDKEVQKEARNIVKKLKGRKE